MRLVWFVVVLVFWYCFTDTIQVLHGYEATLNNMDQPTKLI